MHPAEPQVVLGVDAAGLGGLLGDGEEAARGVLAVSGGLGHLQGDGRHVPRGLEPPLAAVERAARVDRHQAARGVKDVRDRALSGVGVADGVAEYGGDPLVRGESEGAGCVPQRAGSGAAQAVGDDLDAQCRAPVPLPPGREQPGRAVRATGGERAADVRVGAEQYENVLRALFAEHVPGQQRAAALPGDGGDIPVRRGDEPAQFGPAVRAVPGEERHALRRLVDERAAPGRCAPPFGALSRLDGRGHGEVHPEQWPDTGPARGLGEADGAAEGVPVGQGERVEAARGGPLGERVRVRGPVPQGEA